MDQVLVGFVDLLAEAVVVVEVAVAAVDLVQEVVEHQVMRRIRPCCRCRLGVVARSSALACRDLLP